MKWRNTRDDWKRRFLFLPTEIGGEVHWLEWCWKRWAGEYYEVAFGPAPPTEAVLHRLQLQQGGDAPQAEGGESHG